MHVLFARPRTGKYKRGDRVCVKGRLVEGTGCEQGITITVEWIGLARWCQ